MDPHSPYAGVYLDPQVGVDVSNQQELKPEDKIAELSKVIIHAAKTIDEACPSLTCEAWKLEPRQEHNLTLEAGSLFTRLYIRRNKSSKTKKYHLHIVYTPRNQDVLNLFKACNCTSHDLHLAEVSGGKDRGKFANGIYFTKNPVGMRAIINIAYSQNMISLENAVRALKTLEIKA